jgi:hypothetical protein
VALSTIQLKNLLFAYCKEYVEKRIATANQAMQAAQSSANNHEKSSAGDKYETGRAMMQIERDQAALQLAEALKLSAALNTIGIVRGNSTGPGKIVFTDKMNFYIAVSAGISVIDNLSFLTVSPGTPMGKKLIEVQPGQMLRFNNEDLKVISVE